MKQMEQIHKDIFYLIDEMHYASIGSYQSRILLETNLLFSCVEGMKYSVYIFEPFTATKAI